MLSSLEILYLEDIFEEISSVLLAGNIIFRRYFWRHFFCLARWKYYIWKIFLTIFLMSCLLEISHLAQFQFWTQGEENREVMKRRRTFMMMIVMVMNMMMIPVEHRSKCDKVPLKLILSSPHNHRGTRRVCNLIKNVVICIIIIIVSVYDLLHSAVISRTPCGQKSERMANKS